MKQFSYKFDELFNPTLQAIRNLGGSASVTEIEEEVAKLLNLSKKEVNDIHRGNTTKLNYRLRWARTYLKHLGLLENSSRGIWALTPDGLKTEAVDKEKVKRQLRISKEGKKAKKEEIVEEAETPEEISKLEWQEEVLEILQNISPNSFERLCQRVLRELGFINVEVTGRTGDGGIDGKGVIKLGGVLSFHIIFQCKRYKDNISPSLIRDFRGAMVGRADKGLFITTGTFTREAKKEAIRDGAPPIDLIDGFQFAEKLKELELGITTEHIEKVEIRKDWFENF